MIELARFVAAWLQERTGDEWTAESHSGQGLVEYALLIVLVSIACVAALTALGSSIGDVFTQISGSL